ncbi:MAG: hypothetical protein ACREFQ_22130, partial [Stellaceae bacterium]
MRGDDTGLTRRRALKCMMWGSAGVLWTMRGGVPHGLGLGGEALAAEAGDFSFVQVSDTHVGFKAAPNPDPLATLNDGLARLADGGAKPAFMIHTGDVSHLSKPEQFDLA